MSAAQAPLRLGIHLPQFRVDVTAEQVVEAAHAAEEAGADDLWVSDHLLLAPGSERPPESFHEPLTVLAMAAGATRRAGLGTSVLVAPLRPPALVAKMLASLDALSGGRVICGIASGWLEPEFAALGADFARRGARTDETIRLCRALWSGETAFEGRWSRVENLRLSPGPARAGGPPVWVGGNSDAGIRRAARLGDGWHTTIADPQQLAERLRVLDWALERHGRKRAGFVVSVRVRAEAERVRGLAPRLAELGVEHLLVDPRTIDPARLGEQAAELREALAGV